MIEWITRNLVGTEFLKHPSCFCKAGQALSPCSVYRYLRMCPPDKGSKIDDRQSIQFHGFHRPWHGQSQIVLWNVEVIKYLSVYIRGWRHVHRITEESKNSPLWGHYWKFCCHPSLNPHVKAITFLKISRVIHMRNVFNKICDFPSIPVDL